MALASRRLPSIVTRADLAWLLTPTYAAALSVDDDEAHDRLERAMARPDVAEDLLWGISEALEARRGPRTSEDALLDKLSAGLHARRGKVTAAASDPAVSAVLVRINLEIGLAPDALRATLETPKGRAILDAGLRKLGDQLVRELVK
jgi:hypothetical protein